MAIVIDSTQELPFPHDIKNVYFTIDYDGKKYKWFGAVPKSEDSQEYLDAKSDQIKLDILRQHYSTAVVPQLEDKSALESFEAWVSAGCKNAEVSKEIPAVEAKDAVYEDVEVSPAGERQKVVVTEVEEEVTSTVIEKNSSGKYVEKEVTETVTKSSEEPQFEEVPLYHANGQPKNDDDGNPVMHKIPLMEEYEAVTESRLVSAAVEAKDAEQIIISPEKTIEKKDWVDSH